MFTPSTNMSRTVFSGKNSIYCSKYCVVNLEKIVSFLRPLDLEAVTMDKVTKPSFLFSLFADLTLKDIGRNKYFLGQSNCIQGSTQKLKAYQN